MALPAAALALHCLDGVFLSPSENDFVSRVAEELELFLLQSQHERVLLFPPLSSRLRYLIHRTADNVDLLSSFSVGEGWKRRTVRSRPCLGEAQPSGAGDQNGSCSNTSRSHRPLQSRGRGGRAAGLRHAEMPADGSRTNRGTGKTRRQPRRKPDKALYVPRAMRKKQEEWKDEALAAPTSEPGAEVQEEGNCLESTPEQAPDELASCESIIGPSQEVDITPPAPDKKLSEVQVPCEMHEEQAMNEIRVEEMLKNAPSHVTLSSCQIAAYLTVKDISIEKIQFDYSSYGDAQINEGDFGHVIEIYDFLPSLKTEHLMEAFSEFHESGFKIQWVDDTHALGIFSSLAAASQALGQTYATLKIRPLIHGTRQSKIKALQRPKLLQLAKERPQTDTAVARRLVTRALGLQHKKQRVPGSEVLQPENVDQGE
uniref:R3H domain and coiled-coil containing 1 n=1 Tax=Crocodylus porosus TaxID=8502 RepID=A0A7M4G0K6_CROPO